MRRSPFSLTGKVAIVTGASRGLGQAIAVALAEAGADLFITARSRSSLGETMAKVMSGGRNCEVLAQDVCDLSSIAAAVALCRKRFGRIDIPGK